MTLGLTSFLIIALFFFLLLAGMLAIVLWRMDADRDSTTEDILASNYEMNSTVLIPRELAVYRALKEEFAGEYEVLAKVHAVSFILPRRDMRRREWKEAYRALKRKWFDFVLCSGDALQPVVGICVRLNDLDDRAFDEVPFQELCSELGLPLLVISPDILEQPGSLRSTIERAVSRRQPTFA